MTDKLRHLWLMAAAILALASCSQDDVGEGGSPTDDTPVIFSATGITPLGTTRATVDGTWEGTEEVMVEVGFSANPRKYVVKPSDADGVSAKLEAAPGVEPFKWSEVEGNQVKAYTFNSVFNDQSTLEKYRASDIIAGSVDEMTRESVLNFNHQVARVVIKVSNGDIESDKVELVVGSRTITPYRDEVNKRYLALVNRTNGASVSVKIKHGGKDYIYTHATNANLEGGNSYAINVTIDKTMHITDEATLKAWAAAVKDDPTVSAIVDNNFSMTAPADGASNWEPIAEFDGIFDGNGKTISGIVVNQTKPTGFISANFGTVKNLTLKDAKITGKGTVGAVTGNNWKTIENCYVTGNSEITAGDLYGADAGGVAGSNSGYGTILACHVAKKCVVKGKYVGGIAGKNTDRGSITGCYALCSLEGTVAVGGISGCAYGGTSFTACYSKCSYNSSGSNIGGIVGNIWNYNPKFSACYWQGDTNCTKGVGDKTTDPEGVNKITDYAGAIALTSACSDMNNELEGYEYVINDDSFTFADEPLKLKKKTQQ